MANKMADIAVCGCVVTTPELHKTVVEKYGVASRWKQMYLTYDMIRLAWLNEKIVNEAAEILRKYKLNVDEFDTAHDLHNVLNEKYTELFMVSRVTPNPSNAYLNLKLEYRAKSRLA